MAEMKRTTPPKKTARPAHPPLAVKPQPAGPARTPEALAAMGGGQVGYVRAFRAAELRHLFPQTTSLHPSVQLYALFAADGSPLVIADSRDLAVTAAWQNDLDMATLH